MDMKWWQKAVVYQIYPKSFQDSNGDGIGDLQGVIRRLDYIKELGADVIWLCPVNESPMFDNGYDISDYYAINPMFGTNEDMDELIAEAKKRGIRIIMDLVVNHCSYKHEWFQKALQDPEGEYAKYFYFVKGKDGNPPNNWRSIFGGSVWEPVPDSEYYYLHLFVKEQVDLNWENPALRQEIYKMMNYWLDKGIGGFRLDAITYLKKEEGLPSYPADAEDGLVSCAWGSLNRPGIEEFLVEMRENTYGKYDVMTVGEAAGVPADGLMPFVSLKDGYFSMIFDFSNGELDMIPPNNFWCELREWSVEEIKANLEQVYYNIEPDGWIGTCMENHDCPRVIDYMLPEAGQNFYGASMLAIMQMGRPGTPYIYQGQEIGMRNFPFASIEMYDDCSSINQYAYAKSVGYSEKEALKFVHRRSRDNGRYPFSWDETENAGFTEGQPWLPINPNHIELNAARQLRDENSLFHIYQKMIALRKKEEYQETLCAGAYRPFMMEEKNLVAYERYTEKPMEKGNILILCNFQSEDRELEIRLPVNVVLLDNYNSYEKMEGKITLKPYQAVVVLLEDTYAEF